MEIPARVTDWLPTDEENLAKFLETETGKRLIPRLVSDMPLLLAGGDTNSILIRSGEVRAYQAFMETLVTLAHPAAVEASVNITEYPPLHDDRAWADGQKLEPTTPPQS